MFISNWKSQASLLLRETMGGLRETHRATDRRGNPAPRRNSERTRARSDTPELRDPKERAEHIMLVDLAETTSAGSLKSAGVEVNE